MANRALTYVLAIMVLALGPSSAAAQESVHDIVRPGLLHLLATGTPGNSNNPNLGQRNGVQSQGTGFFVGTDGFILTTRHFLDPLEEADARQITITAGIGDARSTRIPVQVASELDRVDLLLLKATLPFDMERPKPLTIGRTGSYDRRNPTPLFTSGFHADTYRRKEVEFNAAESADFPYAWTLNVKTNSGQSGSPVYDADGTVLGVIKATARTDDELTLMIPIEFAMPLIGHLEIDRLTRQVDLLKSIIGEMTQDDPPLNKRLRDIEEDMTELGSRFTWSAETAPDGTLRIFYEKLIGGGVQVDSVSINVKPFMRFREGNETVTRAQRPLNFGGSGENLFQRIELDPKGRLGEFIIPEVHEKLETLARVLADVPVDEPYRNLELTILPTVNGKVLEPRKLSIVPNYIWDLTP